MPFGKFLNFPDFPDYKVKVNDQELREQLQRFTDLGALATLQPIAQSLSVSPELEQRFTASDAALSQHLIDISAMVTARSEEAARWFIEQRQYKDKRQKDIAKLAYLEALREHEAEKQEKEARSQAEALVNIGVGSQVITKLAGMATPIFSEFTNLRANEISLVIMENRTAKIAIRGKLINVNPDELGLKTGSKYWKLLEDAAVSQGCLDRALKTLNSSSDLETEKGKIKTTVSRLRKSLKDAMGLIDDPIKHTNGGGYKFTFKAMTHELLKGGNVSSGADAMDYVNNDGFDDNQCDSGFWSGDE